MLHLAVMLILMVLGLGLLSLYIDGRIDTGSLIGILIAFAVVTSIVATYLTERK